MKQFIGAAFTAIFLCSPVLMHAQDFTHAIGGDPIAYLVNSRLIVTYETKISTANSYTIFANLEPQGIYTGLGAGASYRWYLDVGDGQKALQGFSLAPLAYIMFWSPTGGDSASSAFQLSIGGSAAYKWIFSNGILIEPEVIFSFPLNSNALLSFSDRFIIGVTAGYAWN